MVSTPEVNAVLKHFGILLAVGEGLEIVTNQEFTRATHGLSAGVGTKKKIRAIIDYDPDYSYFVVRKTPIG